MAGSYASYGDSWESVHACCAAADAGCTDVKLICPTAHIGTPIIDGLSAIDLGRFGTHGIGYLSDQYFNKQGQVLGSGTLLTKTTPWVAEETFKWMLDQHGVTVYTECPVTSVNKTGAHLDSIVAGGHTFTADQWHDGIEGGDMAVVAGVSSTYGRESAATYGESLAGFYPIESTFTPFDCFQSPGVLLPGFSLYPALSPGDADLGIMSYTLRVPVTHNAQFRMDWPLPVGYNPLLFEYLRRAMPTDPNWKPILPSPCMFGISDQNGDFGIPIQWGWPPGNTAARDAIFAQIYATQFGWYWWLANDPSVNPQVQAYIRSFGPDSRCCPASTPTPRGVPKQPYKRHSRRMIGGAGPIMTQADLQTTVTKTNVLAMGFYSIDWHVVQRLAVTRGGIPGFITDGLGQDPDPSLRQVVPYQQPYEQGLPNPAEVVNLTCGRMLRMSAVASGSLRIDLHSANFSSGLGYTGGLAAVGGVALSAISQATVRAALLARGQVLAYP